MRKTVNNTAIKQQDYDENNQSALVVLDVGKNLTRRGKLTPAKRKKFLEYLSHNWNISAAAAHIGVSRQSIIDLREKDKNFVAAMDAIKDHYLDCTEDVSLQVALRPSRDGFNDRKLMLQAHRREQYLPDRQTNINVGIQVNNTTSVPEIRQNLQRYSMLIDSDNVTDAHFQDIDNKV